MNKKLWGDYAVVAFESVVSTVTTFETCFVCGRENKYHTGRGVPVLTGSSLPVFCPNSPKVSRVP